MLYRKKLASKVLSFLANVQERLWISHNNSENLPKIVFVHVPKCGGTSISMGLNDIYQSSYYRITAPDTYRIAELYIRTQERYLPMQQLLDEWPVQMVRGTLLFELAVAGQKCITGHIYYNAEMIHALKEMGYRFITILRDPVDRILSNYFFEYYKEDEFIKTDYSFEDYLNKTPHLGSILIKYLGGLRMDERYDSNEAISSAVNNLEDFTLVGRLQEMDNFRAKFKNEFGMELKLRKANRNPAPENKYYKFKNSPENRKMVEEICQPDLKLYEQVEAQSLFV